MMSFRNGPAAKYGSGEDGFCKWMLKAKKQSFVAMISGLIKLLRLDASSIRPNIAMRPVHSVNLLHVVQRTAKLYLKYRA